MATWLHVDWHRLFVPSQPVLETVLRGTFTYLSLFILLRLFRRQTGSLGPADLLVLLLIADASQNALAGEYRSITDGLILVSTIVAWEFILDYLAFKFPPLRHIIERQPMRLIHQGKVNKTNLDKNLMPEDELLSQLRQKGVDDPALVKSSYIEGDGHISVITDEKSSAVQSGGSGRGITG